MNFQLLRNMYAWCIHYLYLFVCRFIKRLVYFFKPTNHLFSRQEFTNERSQKIAHVGCLLIDYLISSERVSNIFLHIYSSPKQINITSYIFYVHTLITQFFFSSISNLKPNLIGMVICSPKKNYITALPSIRGGYHNKKKNRRNIFELSNLLIRIG